MELLNKRAEVVEQVGKFKKETGLPVVAPSREEQVLDRVAEAGSPREQGRIRSRGLVNASAAATVTVREWPQMGDNRISFHLGAFV